MPSPHPPEFRRRAVELARTGDKSVSALAKSLGISQSCLSRWVRQASIDEGQADGLTTAEKERARRAAPQDQAAGTGERDPQTRRGVPARENVLPESSTH